MQLFVFLSDQSGGKGGGMEGGGSDGGGGSGGGNNVCIQLARVSE